jgi:hypothetical protein
VDSTRRAAEILDARIGESPCEPVDGALEIRRGSLFDRTLSTDSDGGAMLSAATGEPTMSSSVGSPQMPTPVFPRPAVPVTAAPRPDADGGGAGGGDGQSQSNGRHAPRAPAPEAAAPTTVVPPAEPGAPGSRLDVSV